VARTWSGIQTVRQAATRSRVASLASLSADSFRLSRHH
jgi:hypothetical protein